MMLLCLPVDVTHVLLLLLLLLLRLKQDTAPSFQPSLLLLSHSDRLFHQALSWLVQCKSASTSFLHVTLIFPWQKLNQVP